jgi:hypothetical protein
VTPEQAAGFYEEGEESPEGASLVIMILEPGCPRCAEIAAQLRRDMS